jgi:pantoate--beta-alanine ligase
VEEIYPADYQKKTYMLGALETVWEGAHRPGHFQGVCQVVERLLRIVEPHTLILGQKDFQQCMVLHRLIGIMGKAEEIGLHIAPTLREQDGLAMSSRNLRLTPEQRIRATAIHRELEKIAEDWKTRPAAELEQQASRALVQAGFSVDYIAIVRQEDLSPVKGTSEPSVVLAAAALGPVRLIDNLPLH